MNNHQHTLQRKESGCPTYICNGCKELGSGSSYYCLNSNCTYILHTECVERVQHRSTRRMRKRVFFGRLAFSLLLVFVDPGNLIDTIEDAASSGFFE